MQLVFSIPNPIKSNSQLMPSYILFLYNRCIVSKLSCNCRLDIWLKFMFHIIYSTYLKLIYKIRTTGSTIFQIISFYSIYVKVFNTELNKQRNNKK